jgi:hypothetical protein
MMSRQLLAQGQQLTNTDLSITCQITADEAELAGQKSP